MSDTMPTRRGAFQRAAFLMIGSVMAISPAQAADVECHTGKDYVIAEKSVDGEVGSQFAVSAINGKPKSSKCLFDAKKADFVIGKPGEPLAFGQLTDSLLVLTRSTGPEGDLVVYDLKTRKSVLNVPSDDYAVEGSALSFWQRTVPATKKNCPDFAANKANGLGSVISVHKAFDMKTGATKELGQSRCDATQ